jgi:hypothetical protein
MPTKYRQNKNQLQLFGANPPNTLPQSPTPAKSPATPRDVTPVPPAESLPPTPQPPADPASSRAASTGKKKKKKKRAKCLSTPRVAKHRTLTGVQFPRCELSLPDFILAKYDEAAEAGQTSRGMIMKMVLVRASLNRSARELAEMALDPAAEIASEFCIFPADERNDCAAFVGEAGETAVPPATAP